MIYLKDYAQILPGTIPSNFNAYNRFYNYSREPGIPHHCGAYAQYLVASGLGGHAGQEPITSQPRSRGLMF